MALVRLKEKKDSRGGGLSSWAEDGRYKRIFVVSYDADVTDETTVAGEAGIPAVGDAHDADSRSQCSAVDCQPYPGLTTGGVSYRHWIVTCRYQVPPQIGWVLNPVNLPWGVKITNRDYEYVPQQNGALDAGGNPVDPQINAAGEVWDEPVVETGKRMVIELTKNVNTPPALSSVRLLSGSVNSASITVVGYTFGVRELWMDAFDISDKKEDSTGTAYYTTFYRLMYREDTWDRYLANVGRNYLSGGVLVPFFIDNSKDPEVPQRLTAAGGDGRANPLNYLQRRIKKEQSWATIGFPAAYP